MHLENKHYYFWFILYFEFVLSWSLYSLVIICHISFAQAKGMNYLHKRNPPVVHRDLKSPNLLVDKKYTVKVRMKCEYFSSIPNSLKQFVTLGSSRITPLPLSVFPFFFPCHLQFLQIALYQLPIQAYI